MKNDAYKSKDNAVYVRGKEWFKSNNMLVIIGAIIIILAMVDKSFLTLSNLKNIGEQYSVLAIVAGGMTFCLISGNIDISVGSLLGLSGVIFGIVFQTTGSIVQALICCIGSAVLVELFNALVIVKCGINPVIVTLAAMIWARGLTMAISNARSIRIIHPLIDFTNTKTFLFFPPRMSLMIFLLFLCWLILNKTRMGRYTYALGGGEEIARQVGINVGRHKILIYVFSGLMVGIASVITITRLGSAQVNAGMGLELMAIASVVIGGNSLYGGSGGIERTIAGVLFVSIIRNRLTNLGLVDSYISFLTGMLLLLTIFAQSILFGGEQ